MIVSGKTRHRVVCCFWGRNDCNLVIQDVESLELLGRVIPFTQLLSCVSPASSAIFPVCMSVRKGDVSKSVG